MFASRCRLAVLVPMLAGGCGPSPGDCVDPRDLVGGHCVFVDAGVDAAVHGDGGAADATLDTGVDRDGGPKPDSGPRSTDSGSDAPSCTMCGGDCVDTAIDERHCGG